MKKNNLIALAIFIVATSLSALSAKGQDAKLRADAATAKQSFLNTDPAMSGLFASSAGYAIFPNIGKAGIAVGGAAGNGVVYQGETIIGSAKMKQLTVGFQLGAQKYREVIFFQDQSALNRFKENGFEFSAQASAVAVTKGASTNVKYREGVMVFTQEKGGLMYEASVGGQKFKFTPN